MVYVASEPIPRFWPMRTFIHHNPLYGLEDRPFATAVAEGSRLFHARGYLDRAQYQDYRREGKIDDALLRRRIGDFLASRADLPPGLDLEAWLWQLMTGYRRPRAMADGDWVDGTGIAAALQGRPVSPPEDDLDGSLRELLRQRYDSTSPVYRHVDALFGTTIAATLDDLLTKSCLDFFDEGQSAWQAPGREAGFFQAWKDLARRNARFLLRGLHLRQVLAEEETAEGMVAHVLQRLQVPETAWQGYITHELTRMHGWAGLSDVPRLSDH